MRVKLTDRLVAGLKPGDEPHFDETARGLSIDAGTGTKTWVLHFTSPRTGKRARIRLGHYPATSLAGARARAVEARDHLDQGRDPKDVLAEYGTMSVGTLVASYLDKHVRPNLRSAKAIERRLSKNVLPIIGSLRLADLHRREISRVVDPILKRGKPVEAARCFEDVRAMFRWALARGDLDHSPIEGMRKPTISQPRERSLADEEIAHLWSALPIALARSVVCQRIVKLCIVTGQRVGEVSGMSTDELDLEKRLWIIPAARSKNKHAHSVPLSALAVDLIEEALSGGEFVFPNDRRDGPLPAHAVAKTIRKAEARLGLRHFTAHDLRRTVVSKMGELGVAPIVLGHVINHRSTTRAGVTLAVYAQYDYAKEKRTALDLWADRLTAIVETETAAKVLPMRKGPR
jgi:integrase